MLLQTVDLSPSEQA